jgi:trimethylamine--corrinoid protein Co-methyltransferase
LRSNFSIQQAPVLRFLTDDQIREIHQAGLEVLESIGVEVLHEEALDLLKGAGALVEGTRVQIPAGLVKKAMATVPSRIVLAHRNGKRSLFLEGRKSYYGTGSCCPYFIDPFTLARRRAAKEDVANMAKLCDYLPHFDFTMSLGLVEDKYPEIGYIHEFDAMARNTTKAIIVSAQDGQNVRDIAEMASAIMGGYQELRRKMLLAVYTETTSPLRQAEDALDKTLACAELWLPVIHTVGQLSGATAPASLAGTLVQADAELMSALVIHQLKQPGAPFFYGGTITTIDMKTMAHLYGNPEFHILSAALTEMGNYFEMPVFSTGGCSDAKSFDAQAAAEGGYSIILESLAGGNLIHDIGYIDSGLTGSLSQVLFSNEMIGIAKHIVKGISYSEEHLGLEAIERVGPGGHYLADEHTARHFRDEFWFPRLMERRSYTQWEEAGKETMEERVNQEVRQVLQEYTPEPLPAATEKILDEQIARFESEARARAREKARAAG